MTQAVERAHRGAGAMRGQMMQLFMAALSNETNTFSPIPTGMRSFQEGALWHGDATRHSPSPVSVPLHAWRRCAEAQGIAVSEGLCAGAQPGGPAAEPVYQSLRDEILANLKRAGQPEIVLLNLHGSMVSADIDDCEGDLLSRVRAVVGPGTVIGAELDLHCSITPQMCEAADLLLTYKEYPHIDIEERAEELFALAVAAARREIRPVMAVHDCRMVSAWWTTVEPVAGFVARMKALEGRDGILSVSFAHGFPWADVPCGTARMLVIADGDADRATQLARMLGEEIFAMRTATAPRYASIEEAVTAIAASTHGPVVLADVSDNPGGGAPGDSTFMLRALLERGLDRLASGIYWDPVAVRFAQEAGEGARFALRLGGKCGPVSGDPLDLNVTVARLAERCSQPFADARVPMGDVAWLRVDGEIDLIVSTVRSQTFHPEAFTALGVDLAGKRAIVVKSSEHYRAGFAPIASAIIPVAAPGTIRPDFAAIGYQRLPGNYWPRLEDPHASS